MKKSQTEATTAENLKEKFDGRKEILDYFDLRKAKVIAPSKTAPKRGAIKSEVAKTGVIREEAGSYGDSTKRNETPGSKKKGEFTTADLNAIRNAEEMLGSAAVRTCIRNFFASGLYLFKRGHPRAADKACGMALRALRLSRTRTDRILRIVRRTNDPAGLALAFRASAEFLDLLRSSEVADAE